ncbi:ABC transporter ATP-binding protein [Mycoplasmopsis primatum]|uniref:ABC transporter ATP-binding protein n=1 Tax=Mycoplasmopsis primatum TaxID=55604 RepID=UPI0004954C73|nr:ABC transporter ATP-binding protein [Mycoplasmopsis primatum]
MENSIVFNNVSLALNKNQNKILNNISFEVKKGQFHGFIGENGAGKTTSFRTLLGFYPTYEGQILIEGIDAKDHKAKSNIGYIPENSTFPTTMSIKEYLIDMAILSGIDKKDAIIKVEQWLNRLNIDEKIWNTKGKNLSSGQKKKISLIQALINDPKVLILDEPAANLDPKVRVELYETLRSLNQENHVTIFISSHILAELEQYIDSLTVLKKGKVMVSGSMEEIREKTDDKNRFKAILNEPDSFINLLNSYNNNEQLVKFSVKNDTVFFQCTPELFKKIIIKAQENNIDFISIGKDIRNLNQIYFDSEGFKME